MAITSPQQGESSPNPTPTPRFLENPAPITTPGCQPEFEDTYAEWDEESTIDAIEQALGRAGEVVRLEADLDFPVKLRETRPDILFNFAEGLNGPSRESHVPAFCEFWNIPYTGSDPVTLGICLDKARTKEGLLHHGVPTPEFRVVDDPDRIPRTVPLPAIVKPLYEGSSKGISQRSYCSSWQEVESEVARIAERYHEPAIIERFLGGREFTVAVLGNDGDGRVLPIVELDFGTLPNGARPLYGFEAKWIWDRPENPLEIFHCPARITPELQRGIETIAMAAFRTLRCRDWARIDVRCDEAGEPYILEVNPLPGVIPDPDANSCYPKAARAAGLSFDELILAVLRAAAARYDFAISS